MADLIQQRRATLQSWQQVNPVLYLGEIGVVIDTNDTSNTDNYRFKIGNGIDAWNDLPYASATADQGALADSAVQPGNFVSSLIWSSVNW